MLPGAADAVAFRLDALLRATPWRLLATVGGGLVATASLVALGALPVVTARVAAIAAGHGTMLALAISWTVVGDARERRHYAVCAVALVAFGATAAAAYGAGAAAYLVVPIWLARMTAKRRLLALGLGTPVPAAALVLGLAAGVFLGGHMLLTATMTFGYRPLDHGLASVLPGVAYDAGVQVTATECFFRGALFNRAQRQSSFASACALATVGTVARYVVDPLLPAAVEVVVGAVFYTALLAIANAWLVWRFGTLVPALVASFEFFVAYRLLPVA